MRRAKAMVAITMAALLALALAQADAFAGPLERDSAGRFLAPVSINGSGPYRLILDTGANRTAVTPQVAEALALPQSAPEEVLSVSGAVNAPVVGIAHLDAGAFEHRNAEAVILSGYTLGSADGVIGMDALEGKRLVIDLERNRFEIEAGGPAAPRGFRTIRGTLRFGHLLEIPVRVGDIDVRAIIDTGAEATLANVALIARAGADAVGREMVVSGAAGEMDAHPAVRLRNVRFGPFAIETLAAHRGDLPVVLDSAGVETPALHLGMDIWRGARVVAIDFARAELQVLL